MLRSCTIFLINQLSAPQKDVDVRLAASVFAHPFWPQAEKKCAGLRQKKNGSLFVAGENNLRPFFCDIFDNFILNFFVAFLSEGSKFKLETVFICPRMKQGFKGSQIQRNRWFQ